MFKINDYVVYKRDVCVIKEIKEHYYKDQTYYVLNPVYDTSLTIQIPIDTPFIRNIITKKELNDLIKEIPNIEVLDLESKYIENVYKELLNSSKHSDLVKIIKTTYLRNKERTDNKKKIGDIDKNYFDKAEKYLYNELMIILDKSYDETKEYVAKMVEKKK